MMQSKHRYGILSLVLALTLGCVWMVSADSPAPDTSATAAKAPATQPATQPSSAEDVIKQLLEQRPQTPVTVEPLLRPATGNPTNPAVLGTAPDIKPGQLRREGEFIVSPAGARVAKSATGGAMLFVFDADGEKSPDAPMILVPCQKTQSMEDIAKERGDRAAFIVTGQVLTYRGANYLLPTISKEDVDRGNLQH